MTIKDKRMLFGSVAEFRANLKDALDFVSQDEDNDVAVWRNKEQRFLLFADSPESYSVEAEKGMREEAASVGHK